MVRNGRNTWYLCQPPSYVFTNFMTNTTYRAVYLVDAGCLSDVNWYM